MPGELSIPGLIEDLGEINRLNAPHVRPPLQMEVGPTIGGQFGGVGPMWHGISQVKLPKPVSEMEAAYKAAKAPVAEKIVTPAELQGGVLLPALGDRSLAGGELTGVGGEKLDKPVSLEGGHGYMAAQSPRGVVWASEKGPLRRLENLAKQLGESGKPVYFPYTAMGERSIDFSHHVADTLVGMLPQAKISSENKSAFDDAMRGKHDLGEVPNWPGIGSAKLGEYLRSAPGRVRTKFAQVMDSRKFQNAGFPSVAEARFAVTDPRLLHERTGASGLSISQLGVGQKAPSQHTTYPEAIAGKYRGGFSASVPKEVMYPDVISHYLQRGYEPYRHDYLMLHGLKGTPPQETNQRWVDTVSAALRARGLLP
jgi:hypothetical protein